MSGSLDQGLALLGAQQVPISFPRPAAACPPWLLACLKARFEFAIQPLSFLLPVSLAQCRCYLKATFLCPHNVSDDLVQGTFASPSASLLPSHPTDTFLGLY